MRKGCLLLFCTLVGFHATGCEEEESRVTDIPPMAEVEPKPDFASSAGLSIERSEEHGAYIVDTGGRALYLLEGEAAGGSDCNAACARVWRPFIAPQASSITADPGVQDNLIGTSPRQDGSLQATYNGHPLYYYVQDLRPGQATGQDVTDAWGEWYLVTPEGRPLEQHEEQTSTTGE